MSFFVNLVMKLRQKVRHKSAGCCISHHDVPYIAFILLLFYFVYSRTTYAVTVSSCLIVVHCRRIYLLAPSRYSVASVVCLSPLITPSISAKVRRLPVFYHCSFTPAGLLLTFSQIKRFRPDLSGKKTCLQNGRGQTGAGRINIIHACAQICCGPSHSVEMLMFNFSSD